MGQSIYEVMLIIACAAMALALFFAAYEYISYYHGPTKSYKFEPAATVTPLPKPEAEAHTLAPPASPTPAPTTAPTAAPGTTAAPATTAPSN
jgi:hypothetical protein